MGTLPCCAGCLTLSRLLKSPWSHCPAPPSEAVAHPVLRHRVLTTFNAEASGVTSDSIVKMLLEHLKPKEDIKI